MKSSIQKAIDKSAEVRIQKQRAKWINYEKQINNNFAKIIDYTNALDVTVKLSNGIILHTTLRDFKRSLFTKYFNNNVKKIRNTHIGETKLMNCGFNATIIRCDVITDIDVQFDDKNKTIVKNRYYKEFEKGNINCPTCSIKPQDRVGKILKNRAKHELENTRFYIEKYNIFVDVIEYRSCTDVLVRFEDNVEVTTTARAVRNCFVRRDDLESIYLKKQNKKKWLGKVFELNDGYTATVVDYEDSEHVTININGKNYISQIRSLNRKSVPKELKYSTISKVGNIHTSVSGMPFKIIELNNGSCKLQLITNKVFSYSHLKAIHDRSAGGRICNNDLVADFRIEGREKFNNIYYYPCSCTKCNYKDILKPVEMVEHAIRVHNFKPAFSLDEYYKYNQ